MAQKSPSSSVAKQPPLPIDNPIEDLERNGAQKLHCSSAAKQPHVPIDNRTEHSERKPTRDEKTTAATTYGLQSAPSTSRTLAYQPSPRRPVRPGRALQSHISIMVEMS
jgi:hypothetical protein